ncbi:MAG: PepSY-associated TM helix domain-containing protein [Actinomycetota bacterium]
MASTDIEAAAGAPTPVGRRPRRQPGPERRWKRDTNKWARVAHVYTSMVALLVVLFFGISGITLNHPTWTFGDDVNTRKETGTLPIPTRRDDGSVDFLSVSEYVRDEFGVSGQVSSFDVVNDEGSISYRNAGYLADLFFRVESRAFELTIEEQGWIGVMNDLHRGRDTRSQWKWVIDVAAVFLVVIALTGLVMQLFLRKRRRSALIGAVAGTVALVVLILITLN